MHGHSGLRVVDASIMPVVIGGATQCADHHDRGKGADILMAGVAACLTLHMGGTEPFVVPCHRDKCGATIVFKALKEPVSFA